MQARDKVPIFSQLFGYSSTTSGVNHVIEFNFDSLSELHSNSVTAAVKFHVHESLPEVGR